MQQQNCICGEPFLDMKFGCSTFTAKDHWKISLVLSKRITFNFLSTYFKKLFFCYGSRENNWAEFIAGVNWHNIYCSR